MPESDADRSRDLDKLNQQVVDAKKTSSLRRPKWSVLRVAPRPPTAIGITSATAWSIGIAIWTPLW
jgi:hypothetical protein